MKPKLAKGSEWGACDIVDADGTIVDIDRTDAVIAINDEPAYVADLLAIVRVTKSIDGKPLDPVWDAAVSAREWWDALGPGRQDLLPGDIADVIRAICRAVEGASDG